MPALAERSQLIPQRRTIIPACDVGSLAAFSNLVEQTADVLGVGAYKIGLELTLAHGVGSVVAVARDLTDRPLILDYQKAGNDIPPMGAKFASVAKAGGVDSVILFPFAGPVTQKEWTAAAQGEGLHVMMGGLMTHPEFLESEGGYISDSAPERIYGLAVDQGITDFVMPGTKLEFFKKYRELLVHLLGPDGFTLYAPGFVAQGGNITEAGKIAGDNWHAIVGKGIYEASNMRQAAIDLTSQIL